MRFALTDYLLGLRKLETSRVLVDRRRSRHSTRRQTQAIKRWAAMSDRGTRLSGLEMGEERDELR